MTRPRFIVRQATAKMFEVFDTDRQRVVPIPAKNSRTDGAPASRQLRVRDQARAQDWAAELNATASRCA